MPLGQYSQLPGYVAGNPFLPLMSKFSRFKAGSYETLFQLEAVLMRWSWLALLVLFALVLPPLEEVDLLNELIQLATLLYPCMFIWSMTRLSGVELLQMILEGRWTGELLASPITNRQLTEGFIAPVWFITRQYLLMSVFSLALFSLETNIVIIDGDIYMRELFFSAAFYYILFLNSMMWIVFVYLGRLYVEARLRNGLLKGLVGAALILGGFCLFGLYVLLFIWRPWLLTDPRGLTFFLVIALVLGGLALRFGLTMHRHFREFLMGQIDLDRLIYDHADPKVSAWQKCESTATARAQ